MRIAVVGGGITGLAAALTLRELLPAAEVTVYEQSPHLGGKLRTGELLGVPVELGAETFLCRDPGQSGESAVLRLARRVGLGDALVHPEPVAPALVVDGELRPLPPGTLLGVPADPAAVRELIAADGGQAARDLDRGRPLLSPGEDVAVGALVRRRFGDAVVDRLVDPMLGGVYAGHADDLSLAATMPGLAAAARVEHTLTAAVRSALAASGRPAGTPVFATVTGGLGRLPAAIAAASDATVRTGAPVRRLTPAGRGWQLVLGSTRDAVTVAADAVVLAVPARPAARLLGGVDQTAADHVGGLDYASVALVTLAFPPGTDLPERSGLLVPASEQMLIKAATFFPRKWAHLRSPTGPVLVRASIGRYGEEVALHADDSSLAGAAYHDLARLLPGLPPPTATRVQRWGGALPQYPPGHLERVADARRRLPATLRLAGAAYDGVGIAACVRSGQAAAQQVAATLEESAA